MELAVTSIAEETLRDRELRPGIEIDCEVSPGLFAEQYNFIQSLAPFGEGNRAPVFLTRKAKVVEARQIGSNKSHLKMRVAHSNSIIDAIAFRQGDRISLTRERIDLVYNIGLDTWGGRAKLQMTVMDFRPSV
jgi:single-stranded-DNA-specific exonuclease